MDHRRRHFLMSSLAIAATPTIALGAKQHGIDFSKFAGYRPGAFAILPSVAFTSDIVIEVNGTAAQPLTIKSVVAFRTVFRGHVTIKGSYAVLEGMQFEGRGSLRFEGEGHKVRNCRFEDGGGSRAIMLTNGTGQSVEHCLFRNWDNAGIAVTGSTQNSRIYRCLFDNRAIGLTNGAAVQLGLGDRDAYRDLSAKVELCRFVGWSAVAGKDKVLTMKSSGNHVLQCTFESCNARVQVRYGAFNTIEGCYLFDSRCIRVLDKGNRVLGCLIRKSASQSLNEQGIVVAAGNIAAASGDVNLPGGTKDGHPHASETIIAGCDVDFTNIGAYYSGHTMPAVETIIRAHRSLAPIKLVTNRQRRTDSRPDLAYSGSHVNWRYLTDGEVGPI